VLEVSDDGVMLCRGRVCALGVLLTLYLAGVLLISTVTLDAQHKVNLMDSDKIRFFLVFTNIHVDFY
jgi:hypothetical protein